MVGTHMPSRPQATKAAAQVRARRMPARRQATRAARAVTPVQPAASRRTYTARTDTTTALLMWPKK